MKKPGFGMPSACMDVRLTAAWNLSIFST
jgi:hypothetical protein